MLYGGSAGGPASLQAHSTQASGGSYTPTITFAPGCGQPTPLADMRRSQHSATGSAPAVASSSVREGVRPRLGVSPRTGRVVSPQPTYSWRSRLMEPVATAANHGLMQAGAAPERSRSNSRQGVTRARTPPLQTAERNRYKLESAQQQAPLPFGGEVSEEDRRRSASTDKGRPMLGSGGHGRHTGFHGNLGSQSRRPADLYDSRSNLARLMQQPTPVRNMVSRPSAARSYLPGASGASSASAPSTLSGSASVPAGGPSGSSYTAPSGPPSRSPVRRMPATQRTGGRGTPRSSRSPLRRHGAAATTSAVDLAGMAADPGAALGGTGPGRPGLACGRSAAGEVIFSPTAANSTRRLPAGLHPPNWLAMSTAAGRTALPHTPTSAGFASPRRDCPESLVSPPSSVPVEQEVNSPAELSSDSSAAVLPPGGKLEQLSPEPRGSRAQDDAADQQGLEHCNSSLLLGVLSPGAATPGAGSFHSGRCAETPEVFQAELRGVQTPNTREREGKQRCGQGSPCCELLPGLDAGLCDTARRCKSSGNSPVVRPLGIDSPDRRTGSPAARKTSSPVARDRNILVPESMTRHVRGISPVTGFRTHDDEGPSSPSGPSDLSGSTIWNMSPMQRTAAPGTVLTPFEPPPTLQYLAQSAVSSTSSLAYSHTGPSSLASSSRVNSQRPSSCYGEDRATTTSASTSLLSIGNAQTTGAGLTTQQPAAASSSVVLAQKSGKQSRAITPEQREQRDADSPKPFTVATPMSKVAQLRSLFEGRANESAKAGAAGRPGAQAAANSGGAALVAAGGRRPGAVWFRCAEDMVRRMHQEDLRTNHVTGRLLERLEEIAAGDPKFADAMQCAGSPARSDSSEDGGAGLTGRSFAVSDENSDPNMTHFMQEMSACKVAHARTSRQISRAMLKIMALDDRGLLGAAVSDAGARRRAKSEGFALERSGRLAEAAIDLQEEALSGRASLEQPEEEAARSLLSSGSSEAFCEKDDSKLETKKSKDADGCDSQSRRVSEPAQEPQPKETPRESLSPREVVKKLGHGDDAWSPPRPRTLLCSTGECPLQPEDQADSSRSSIGLRAGPGSEAATGAECPASDSSIEPDDEPCEAEASSSSGRQEDSQEGSTEESSVEISMTGPIDASSVDGSGCEEEYWPWMIPRPCQESLCRANTMLGLLEKQELYREVEIIVPAGMGNARAVTFVFDGTTYNVTIPDGNEEGSQVKVSLPIRRPPLERNSQQARLRDHMNWPDFTGTWEKIKHAPQVVSLENRQQLEEQFSFTNQDVQQRISVYQALRGRSMTPLLAFTPEEEPEQLVA
eukprot:TRINITY_DN15086_c0_g1_i1.p1 TRINITY_DN15086_c0_g1~~TRINITY_DN15086_c0_g1_i1.p1  ORF type:complete len:1308 (-),score=272.91 TRINITY_DN15086_c0_g1_i1:228-4151(-)